MGILFQITGNGILKYVGRGNIAKCILDVFGGPHLEATGKNLRTWTEIMDI